MATGGEFDARRGQTLLTLARQAIAIDLGLDPAPKADSEVGWLEEPAATFVTLELDGRLRGCIGSLSASKPLRDDVTGNARAAAFEDPRFAPVTRQEFAGLRVEVSILSPAEPIECSSEEELLMSLRPGIDGLVLECGRRRATFLPQVWENCGGPRRFVRALKRKAGLPSDFWSEEIRFSRYTVEKYSESD